MLHQEHTRGQAQYKLDLEKHLPAECRSSQSCEKYLRYNSETMHLVVTLGLGAKVAAFSVASYLSFLHQTLVQVTQQYNRHWVCMGPFVTGGKLFLHLEALG